MQSLFQPFTFNNGTQLKNRLVVAPMTHWGSTPDGHLSEEERRFLQGRAEGFGLFITAATLVSPEGKAFAGQPYALAETDLESLKQLAALLHAQGAKAVLQIHHGGKLAMANLLDGQDIVAPSDDAESGARAMTTEEITQVVEAFGRATDLAIRAGFDGVEIHGANRYLIQQFFSPLTNRRNDEWGGTLEKRLHFPLAVTDAVLAVRDRHQRPDFIVGYRFSPEEVIDNGITPEDSFALIDALCTRPLQYLHVSLWDFFTPSFMGKDREQMLITQLHEHLADRLPLIGVGNLLTAADIQRAIDTGSAELIALGKAVLLNPSVATRLQQGDTDGLETELDPARKAFYRFPERLWALNQKQPPFLPKLKQ